jgi:tetracycline resistance efflux pump
MSFLAFLPPLVVFTIGILFHRISTALIVGIILAGLIATNFALLETTTLVASRFINTLEFHQLTSWATAKECDTLFIFGFLIFSGILIELITISGGAKALIHLVSNSIKTRKRAETSVLALSHCLFIDDYLCSLTVGSVLCPLTDKLRVPRVKLAFLVNALAASLAVICPISSWAAAISGFLSENGIGEQFEEHILVIASPSAVYLQTLPYILFSFTLIATVWAIVRWRFSFGLMAHHEQQALAHPEESTSPEGKTEKDTYHLADFLVPLLSLMFLAVFWLLFWGEYTLFGGSRSLVAALQNAPIALVLFLSSLIAATISLFYFFFMVRRLSIKRLPSIAFNGFYMMLPAISVLTLAWTLGDLLRIDLKTGEVLAALLGRSIPLFFLPCLFFWIASGTSLALGSAWGTAALIFPIAIPMVITLVGVTTPTTPEEISLLFPVLGAILSGSICGGMASMMSDTSIMSSTSSSCDHLEHVKTQWRYVMPVFVGTSCGFIVAGILSSHSFTWSLVSSLSASIAVSIGLCALLSWHDKKKHTATNTTN